MQLEIDPYDRSYILYNIGHVHISNGEHTKALEYYFWALEQNTFLPQAFNNIVMIYHYDNSELVEASIALILEYYIETQNWLKITRRFELDKEESLLVFSFYLLFIICFSHLLYFLFYYFLFCFSILL
ncbi:hypothetical protein K2173_017617 [Erythroxylum novogranatense]|uniref:Photosystem I assembly protein Ycf3 n=1 Tax=Erythroxylum novogranatense TaxID=1862640 RepID=A0AAV8TLC9_9ROSI|nr:hypothetical protein K2173_017617 [Erythroxylum novogranatense]